MKQLKEYLAPELVIVEFSDNILTNSKENNATSDPYDPNGGNQWWE